MWEKLKTLEDAKKLAAGPAGIEFEKYPLKFVTPAYFGARPQPGTPITVSSGSASLVRHNGQSIALTCSHVLEGYRKRLAEGPCIFQLGDCELDPMAQLKAEDKGLDYALVVLTAEQSEEVAKSGGPFDGTFFYEIAQWPPGEVKEGDFVAFGGFPGALRQAESFDKLSFGSYSSGAARVAATGENYLVCQFEREHWVKHGFEPEPSTIRGMSGGPVFAIRHSQAGIMTYDFVGHITEFHEQYELLYVRLARVLPL
ncbi:MAG TPA: serine protease [Candidatus Paceibacterota bacterium]|nr:serine protease [Candidatus Paceibacterota bacterium]